MRIQLSPSYWLYYLATVVAISEFGRRFFERTERQFFDHESEKPYSRAEKLWWHFFLLRYAYFLNDDTIESLQKQGRIVMIKHVDYYDYSFWNNCYMVNCIAKMLHEMAKGKVPFIEENSHLFASFFKFPIEVSSENSVECDDVLKHYHFNPRHIAYNRISNRAWCQAYKYLVKLNVDTASYVTSEMENILTNKKVLGVIARGTDYIATKPKGHPKQPSIEELVAAVKKHFEENDFDCIYVASEEKRIVDAFEDARIGKVLTNKRKYYDKAYSDGGLKLIYEVRFDRENDNYYKGLEYLSSMYILSKCHSLIGGNCGGAQIALCLNNNQYEYVKVFDRGVY